MKPNPYQSLLAKLAEPASFEDSHRHALAQTASCANLKDWNHALLSLCQG